MLHSQHDLPLDHLEELEPSTASRGKRDVQALTTRQRSRSPGRPASTGVTGPLTSSRSPSRPIIRSMREGRRTVPWPSKDTRDDQHPLPRHRHRVVLLHHDRAVQAGEQLVRDGAVQVGVAPEGAGGVVRGELVVVVERLPGVDREERVVGVALRGDVQPRGRFVGSSRLLRSWTRSRRGGAAAWARGRRRRSPASRPGCPRPRPCAVRRPTRLAASHHRCAPQRVIPAPHRRARTPPRSVHCRVSPQPPTTRPPR